jgi:2-oxoglutarate ferredoxin oxidoreductase subunit alpha
MEPVEMHEKPPSPPEKPWAVSGTGRNRPKNIINSLYLFPEELEKANHDRFKVYKKIEETEPRCEKYQTDDAEIIVTAYGAVARVAKNAVDEMRAEGLKVGLLRPVTLWPFPAEAFKKAAETAKAFVSAEMSMGQMMVDVELAIRCTRPVSLCSRVGGVVPTPDDIKGKVKEVMACL